MRLPEPLSAAIHSVAQAMINSSPIQCCANYAWATLLAEFHEQVVGALAAEVEALSHGRYSVREGHPTLFEGAIQTGPARSIW